MSAWFKPSSTNQEGAIFQTSMGYMLFNNNQLEEEFRYIITEDRQGGGGNQHDYRLDTSGIIMEDTWHFAVMTGTADNSEMKAYLDGEFVGNLTYQFTGWNSDLDYANIGAMMASLWPGNKEGVYFPGLIDEVALFDRALSAEEIGRYYQLGLNGQDLSVVPIPSALWLLGSGLIGLIGCRRRKGKSITKRALVASLMLLFLGSGIPGYAATVTQFTDEGAFKAALSSYTTYNFDSLVLDDGILFGQPFEILDIQIPGIDFDNSIVYPGGSGGTFRSPPNVVLNQDLLNPIVFTFTTPVTAVGLFNTSLVDAERFEIYDSGDNLLASINLPDVVVNFGGFISDVGISKGVVVPILPTNGSIYIDDLTVGSSVPVPGSILLLGSGLIGLVGFRRKYRKSQSKHITFNYTQRRA